MLFNSIQFILFFLPVTLTAFFVIGRNSPRGACAWLAFASLFFYGWWDARYLLLLLASISGNFLLGRSLSSRARSGSHDSARKLLIAGVTANIFLLGYYKYANFFLENLANLSGFDLQMGEIVLPLGISFFTFTQIAFLVDCRQGKVLEYNFLHYLLFVTYFPHLIAGPILHHAQMMPQFAQRRIYRPQWNEIAIGLAFFSIGLFKKVIVADGISPYVGPVFAAAAEGRPLTCLEATSGALGYTLQLYFDFSGYCDMAIGLSRLFGIRLPVNFDSPYKSASLIEFWRRWHMTLSAFLRDYLYIPLGGNRLGIARRHINLLATMLLGGLWHGAAWTFVIWGAGHGLLLALNHVWRQWFERQGWRRNRALYKILATGLTFSLVVVLWVFFRAQTVPAAQAMLYGMFGGNGLIVPETWKLGSFGELMREHGFVFAADASFVTHIPVSWFFWCLLAVFFAPNSQQIAGWAERGLLSATTHMRSFRVASVGALFGLVAFWSFAEITRVSEFLYFQF